MEIDGPGEFTESEIQAWRSYFGQVGHRYEVEAVKWLVAAEICQCKHEANSEGKD